MNKVFKDNKGFTLVELIIVVAIIAALAAFLAPTYLQYVEKSKVSSDIAKANVIRQAAVVACIDEENGVGPEDEVEVVWNTPYPLEYRIISVSITPSNEEAARKVTAQIASTLSIELNSGDPCQTAPVDAQSKMASSQGFTVSIQNGVATIDESKSPLWKEAMGG